MHEIYMKQKITSPIIGLFLSLFSFSCHADGISGGIAVGNALAKLALVWGVIGICIGIAVTYVIYKKTLKKWVWITAPILSVSVFFALWAFTLSRYSGPFFEFINPIFGTNY